VALPAEGAASIKKASNFRKKILERIKQFIIIS